MTSTGWCVGFVVTVLVIAASALHWLARPHIFSLLIFTVWYYLLDLYQYRDKFLLYFMPPLMLIWVNLHGGFILGFILLVIYGGSNAIRYVVSRNPKSLTKAKVIGGILLVCLLVSLINPNGFNILLFPFETYSQKFMIDHIGEFRSPEFSSASHRNAIRGFDVIHNFASINI